ncbi:S8 family serine peptidase [Blastococcus sp. VKM Ac-2987]|uniref:S8 family serine peptidase n=1 Tax=Blastococcus sp. VKM Ac-2987 TaxID=3004141 RepID=UPI0022AB6819|nr:S8 family serine peptidase [Blastococcus sp. VKM Ac-2987]MCZ2859090.1 S8 family serine peptidase [Blastococcus sp. VKM Ac-2987]
MTSKKVLGVVLTSAVVAGYAGAAVYTAWAAPAVQVATDFGDGDGLTRYVVTASAADAVLLGALEAVPGVAHAQPLDEVSALVATDGVTADRLRAVAGVDEVATSQSVPVLGTVTDPYFPQYGWNLENTGTNSYHQPVPALADADVDATSGWETGTGAGRIVAVVDTGFDSDHVELAGSLWTNPDQACGAPDTDGNGLAGDCHGWNFYANNADVDNGSMGTHGTSVAGVVGARAGNGAGTAGVAPGVTLMPLVIGGGGTVDVNAGAKAIRYAVDNGADVITASWGGEFTGFALQNLRDAVAYAAAHDVLVVAAAGNDALDRDSSILYPASLPDPNVITVGSSTAGDTISPSSAYGATDVDLFAPGYLVLTTWNDGGVRLVGGTSIAGPQVAAAVALYRAAMPMATAAEIKAALLADVDLVPAFVGKSVTGGRLTMSRLAEGGTEPVQYAFTSMTARPGVVTPTIGISGSAGSGEYSVAIGLGMEHAGEIWALSQKAVTLDGVTVSTDDAGDARFDLGTFGSFDGTGLSPAVELAEGRYVLTVQLYRDDDPLGRMHAAPLLVSSASPSPDGGSPAEPIRTDPPSGTSPDDAAPAPGGTSPGGTTPGPGTGTAPLPGSAPGGTSPGESTPDGTTPDGATPDDTVPDSTVPDGTTPDDTVPDGTTPDDTVPDGTTPDGSTPGTSPDSSTPGDTTPGTTPEGTAPDGSTPEDGGGTPAPPGTTTYPEVGVFRITSLGPDRVSTSGGTLVTITGRALPADPTVRIGATTTGTVVSSSTTDLVVRVPARVAGTYDVSVYARDGRSTVLSNALTYADEVGTAPTDPADGSDPGGPMPDGSTPDGGTTPDDTTPGSTSPDGSTPDDGTPDGGAPAAGPVVRSGPAGERLVRSDRFRPLGSIWSMSCASSCTGVAL